MEFFLEISPCFASLNFELDTELERALEAELASGPDRGQQGRVRR
jgi:hypothetical protein